MVLKKKEIIAASLVVLRSCRILELVVSRYNKGTGRRKLR